MNHLSTSAETDFFSSTPVTLLGQVLAEKRIGKDVDSEAARTKATARLDEFLSTSSKAKQLQLWLGRDRLSELQNLGDWIAEQLDRDIAKIDSMVELQLNTILHADPFQRLEASWRGIEHLTTKREQYSDSRIVIRVLNVSWAELNRDFEGANEFDQSLFFRKVYEEGVGQSGADPFSVLIADYFVHPRLSREHRFDDMNILRGLAQVAAAAFCPLITNAHSSMFAVDRFSDLKNSIDLQALHSGLDFFAWQRFREIEDSRFVCLAMPRMLMRTPYRDNYTFGFPFEERVAHADDYLWGGAAFGMAEVLMRAFADSGWFANIRGAQRGVDGGGLVTGPAFDPFDTEPHENASRPITDIVLSDEFEKELSGDGFLPMCACKDMPLAAFYSASSSQKAKEYNSADATMSARLSTMLNYMLCVSRFAHYLKAIARDKIGHCGSPEELQDILNRWITDYVSPDMDASASTRMRKPLLEAEIKVLSIPGRSGEYASIFHLVPHHELDDMRVSIRLDTKLLPAR
jgi:type VI secretion system ImpC/EvpB family protein